MNAPAQTPAAIAPETDIAVLLPDEAKIIKTSKGDVEIKTLETRQIRAAVKQLAKVRHLLGKNLESLDVKDLFIEQADTIIALVAIMSDKSEEFIDSLPFDEAVIVATAVLETNVDFFIQKVLPLLTALVEKLTDAMGRGVTGLTPSNP